MLFVSEYGFIPYSKIPGNKQSNPGIESGISTPDPGIPGIGNPKRNPTILTELTSHRSRFCHWTILKNVTPVNAERYLYYHNVIFPNMTMS